LSFAFFQRGRPPHRAIAAIRAADTESEFLSSFTNLILLTLFLMAFVDLPFLFGKITPGSPMATGFSNY
jgi:hypothetical protein